MDIFGGGGVHYSAYHTGLEARKTELKAGTVKHAYAWALTGHGEEGER